jgi:hypothetical protein
MLAGTHGEHEDASGVGASGFSAPELVPQWWGGAEAVALSAVVSD